MKSVLNDIKITSRVSDIQTYNQKHTGVHNTLTHYTACQRSLQTVVVLGVDKFEKQ